MCRITENNSWFEIYKTCVRLSMFMLVSASADGERLERTGLSNKNAYAEFCALAL